MNAIIHLAAALAFFGLGYWLILLQRHRRVLRTALEVFRQDQNPQPRVHIGWHAKQLAALCQALGVPFEAEGAGGGKPVRLDLAPLIKVHGTHGLGLVELRTKDGQGHLDLRVLGGEMSQIDESELLSSLHLTSVNIEAVS